MLWGFLNDCESSVSESAMAALLIDAKLTVFEAMICYLDLRVSPQIVWRDVRNGTARCHSHVVRCLDVRASQPLQ